MGVNILGIETSCDETAAAVVRDGRKLLSNVIVSQIDVHKEFGGVVPEVAARSHIEAILPTIDKAVMDAQITWDDIDGIAVAYGPGLSGSLLIGVLTARTLALLQDKPLYAVNHVEAHTYANFLAEHSDSVHLSSALPSRQPQFPMLSLTVSGGHSQLILFHNHGDYELLGQTQDDAAGEAFDKVARMLGLGYPGGPAIAQAAAEGDAERYQFPEAQLDNPYDFSFSGLKTAVLRHLQELIGADYTFPSFEIAQHLDQQQVADTAASFQAGLVETLVTKTAAAYQQHQPASVVIAGGVAANQFLREQIQQLLPTAIEYVPIELCTDNAAMIAARASFNSNALLAQPRRLEVQPSLAL